MQVGSGGLYGGGDAEVKPDSPGFGAGERGIYSSSCSPCLTVGAVILIWRKQCEQV